MSGSKRRCATCRHFQDGVIGGAGWCTHPKRQESSDVRILVRPAELACRNAWGVDFWESRNAEQSASSPSMTEPTGSADDRVEIPSVAYDDEVTSVVSADFHRGEDGDSGNDRVVDQKTILPDDEEDPHGHHVDRFDLLAHGGRDAVSQARRRAVQRRSGRPVDEEADMAPEPSDAPAQGPVFEPDDFVEAENPSPAATAEPERAEPSDDVVISEDASAAGTPRSRRLRRHRGQSPSPKAKPVVMTGADRREPVQPSTEDNAYTGPGRFDSIPDVSADVDISRFLREERRQVDPDAPASRPVTNPVERTETNFDEAIRRAQAIKAAARAEREARQKQRKRPITPPVRTASVEPEPAPPVEGRARISTRDIDNEHDMPLRATAMELDPAPAYDVHGDDEAYDDSVEVLAEEPVPPIAPQDDIRRSWWRGMFAERQAPEPIRDERDGYPEDEFDTASYAYSDVAAYGHEDEWEDLAADSATRDDEPLDDESWIEAESGFEDIDDVDDSYEDPDPQPYTPINLEDDDGLSTFRSRLFGSGRQGPRRAPHHLTAYDDEMETQPAVRAEAMAAPVVQAPEKRARWADGLARRAENAPAAAGRRVPDIDPDDLLHHPDDAWYEPDVEPNLDLRALVGRQPELLDMTIEIAPEVPRQCATCRSYRQAEHGDRGWCTNNYAFTHRQMVNADDLACKSTIGCWWLPADEEVWLSDDEPDTAATPRVDRLIAHLEPARRAVGR